MERREIALIIIFISLALGVGLQRFGALPGGFVALAISPTDYDSNDADLQAPSITLTVSQNGQGEYAYGTLAASEIKWGDKQAAEDFTLEMFMDKHQAQYPIKISSDTNSHFYRAEYESQVNIFQGDFKTTCTSRGDLNPLWYENGYTATCIWFTRDSTLGTVGQVNLVFESRLKATVGSEVAEATISNLGSTSTLLMTASGTRLAYVYWAGNLVTGESPPSASAFGKVAWAPWKSQWVDITDTKYDEYKNYLDNGLMSCMSNWAAGISGSDAVTCTGKLNSLEEVALTPNYIQASGGSWATSTGIEKEGQFIIDLQKLVQYPVFSIRVNALSLGVYTPVGMPKLISVTAPSDVETGKAFYLTVTGQNIGTVLASFGVKASCTGASTPNTEFLSLDKGASGTVYLTSYASTGTTTSYSCTVTMYDRNNPSATSASMSVTGNVRPIIICTPGARRANGYNIEQCNAEGSRWTVVQTCPTGQYAGWQNGVLQCLSSSGGGGYPPGPTPPPGGGCGSLDFGCQLTQALIGFFKIILTAFGVLIGIGVIILGLYILVKIIIMEKILGRG